MVLLRLYYLQIRVCFGASFHGVFLTINVQLMWFLGDFQFLPDRHISLKKQM